MIVWAVADRVLPMIGLGTVIYFTVRLTLWAVRRRAGFRRSSGDVA